MSPKCCIEVLFQALKIIKTFCSSNYLTFNLEELVLMLDLIHEALKRTDTDMMSFACDALADLIIHENNPNLKEDESNLDSVLAGITEQNGILYTIINQLNLQEKLTTRKTMCVMVLAEVLTAISTEMYPHVLRLFRPIPPLLRLIQPLRSDGTTTDLNYDACKCLSLLIPHCKDFRSFLGDEKKFITLMKNFDDCAASADIQEFAQIILKELNVSNLHGRMA